MILIITDAEDLSTYEVLDWLDLYEQSYMVLTDSDQITIESLTIASENTDFVISNSNRSVRYSNISAVWYRRGRLNLRLQDFPSTADKVFDDQIVNQLNLERSEITNFIWTLLREKSINTQLDNFTNKLVMLELCKKHGIKIPDSLVCSSKINLVKFYKDHENIISKNISPGVFIKYEDSYFGSHTLEIGDTEIHRIAEKFAPLLVQEMIEKSFEVRSFFMDGKFYSSAILSQSDEQTKVDFRNYNKEKPNRTPPFQLPKDIEIKLTGLMSDAKLRSGSIDLIVDPNGEYYFLEVNPVGQFKQVSYPCNYLLEKKIAQKISNVKEISS